MKFLTISVILSFLACIAFTVVCLVMTRNGYEVSDSLIQWFFTVFGVEFATAGAIQIVKYRVKKQEVQDYIEELKQNGFELTKTDFKTKNNDDYYYYNDYTEGDDSVG
jgi:hypothetical protein